MIEVTQLRKEFSTVLAVDDVSFAVRPGEIFGLIGPNGAGKSTTIRMIMNILRPDRGEIRIGGKSLTEETKNILGYLPEERGLYRRNRLLNTITYFGTLKGLPARQARERGARMLDRFQLSRYAHRRIEELSKGNQQKVQFIIAVLHEPPVLVLDELFSGFDPINQELMKNYLLDLKRQNRTIIFSTHQMDHAEKLCDTLCLINKGRMVLNGSPASIKERYGRNWVRIRYEGPMLDPGALTGIARTSLFGTQAELELEPGVRPNQVLQQLLGKVELQSFERIEPSLHAIFIDVVGADGDADGGDQQHASAAGPQRVSRDGRLRMSLFLLLIMAGAAVVSLLAALKKPDPDWSTPLLFLALSMLFLWRYRRRKRQLENGAPQADRGGEEEK